MKKLDTKKLGRALKVVLIIGTALDKNVPISHSQRLAKEGAQPLRYAELPTSQHVSVSEKDRDMYRHQLKLFLDQF